MSKKTAKQAERAPHAAGGPRPGRKTKLAKLSWSSQFSAVLGLMAVAALVQFLVDGPLAQVGNVRAIALVLGLGAAVCAAVMWGKQLYDYLAGATAAAVILTLMMVMTAIGTVIVQDAPPGVFMQRYGAFGAPLVALGFDDIFHSYAFGLLIFLVAVMSVVTVIRRRKTMLRWRHLGLLLTHTSVVMVIVGGAIGAATNSKGMMHLTVGEAADTYVPEARPGIPAAGPQKVDFQVVLDSFKLDNYNVELKAYTYKMLPGDKYDLVAADTPEPGKPVGAPGPDSDTRVVTKRVLKRGERVIEWVSAASVHTHERGGLAAPLRFERAGKPVAAGHMHPAAPIARDPAGRFEVRLVAQPPAPSELAALAHRGDKTEFTLRVGAQVLAVQPGGSYELPDGRLLKVESFLPDFTYDNRTRQAITRSNEPNNPALVVQVSNPAAGQPMPQTAYLFGKEEMRKMMGQMKSAAADILFQHQPGAAAVGRSIVVVADKAERIVVEEGKVIERAPMKWGEGFKPLASGDDTVVVDQPITDAVRHERWVESANGQPFPALEVEVQQGAHKHAVVLPAYGQANPVRIANDRILVYREKPNKVKNYESTVSILQGGKKVLTQRVKVNEPLEYGGWHFYQSNYDPDNPRYSGLQLVKDPGLPLVTLAFWLLMYGVLHTVALRNWIPPWERGRKKDRPDVTVDDQEDPDDEDDSDVARPAAKAEVTP